MSHGSLGSFAWAQCEARRVIPAATEAEIDAFLASPTQRVLWVQGSAGTGKSTVARQVALRAEQPLVWIDGRQLSPVAEALDALLEEAFAAPDPLLVIDSWELLEPLGSHLREFVLPALPKGARVVIAGRVQPAAEWLEPPWSGVLRVISTVPLSDAEARQVLADTEPAIRDAIVAWADGLQLALTLGAAAGAARSASLNLRDLDRMLLDHLTGEELSGADRDVLAVAAVASAVDARLLADVLPGVDGNEAEEFVRSLSFSEPVGRAVTLHERVRTLLQQELAAYEPEYDRQLRIRILDHLAERAVASEPHLIANMQDLVDPGPGTFVRTALNRFRLDVVRPGDVDMVVEWFGRGPDDPYARRFISWMTGAPGHVIVVRDRERLAALALWATPQRQPDLDDPVLAAWNEYAAEHEPLGRVAYLPDVILFTEPEHWIELLVIGNVAMLVRAGLSHLRYSYIGHDAHADGDVAGGPAGQVALFGGVPTPGLDVAAGGLRISGYVIDYGPTGVVGATRDAALAALTDKDTTPPALTLDASVVRRALRNLHRPLALRDSPLASGATTAERADAVADRITRGLDDAFAATPQDALLRQVIEVAYLDPSGGHKVAMRTLHLSRTTYYRRLADATERLAESIVRDA